MILPRRRIDVIAAINAANALHQDLSRVWSGWQQVLAIVQPATVIRWHREGFGRFWARKSRRRNGRPELDGELCALIRKMLTSNPTWGAPRIRNELAKIGINVSRSTVAEYMVRHRKPPSPRDPLGRTHTSNG